MSFPNVTSDHRYRSKVAVLQFTKNFQHLLQDKIYYILNTAVKSFIIQSFCHFVILSFCHFVIYSVTQLLTLTFSHLAILSFVTKSFCHLTILISLQVELLNANGNAIFTSGSGADPSIQSDAQGRSGIDLFQARVGSELMPPFNAYSPSGIAEAGAMVLLFKNFISCHPVCLSVNELERWFLVSPFGLAY
jgi:hypothetical protein